MLVIKVFCWVVVMIYVEIKSGEVKISLGMFFGVNIV